MNGHHLILGELRDFITNRTLPDTHDERYRQKLARLLVEQKGFAKADLHSRRPIHLDIDGHRETVVVDLSVSLDSRTVMIVKYGPGSLVTRHRPALAASRLLEPYQIPYVVVTNGEDADILDGAGGNLLAQGLTSIPSRQDIATALAQNEFSAIPTKRAQAESRILYCYDVDGRCPCDGPLCEI